MPQVRKYAHKAEPGEADAKGKTCNIKGCNSPAVRSLSRELYDEYLKDAGLTLKSDKERKVMPCEAHYKMLKKGKKKDDKISKVKFGVNPASKIGARGYVEKGIKD
jgi:hypothetical protein